MPTGARRADGVELDGQKLKSRRLECDFTQGQVAEVGGVTREYISRLETGTWTRVSRKLADALASKLGVPVAALTVRTAERNTPLSRQATAARSALPVELDAEHVSFGPYIDKLINAVTADDQKQKHIKRHLLTVIKRELVFADELLEEMGDEESDGAER